MGQDAPGAQHAAPKVETPPAPEEEEEPDVELNGDVKGHAREGRHGHGLGEVLRDVWSAAHGDGLAAKLAVVGGEVQETRVGGRRGHDKAGPPTRIYFAPLPLDTSQMPHMQFGRAPLHEVPRGLVRGMDRPSKSFVRDVCSRAARHVFF